MRQCVTQPISQKNKQAATPKGTFTLFFAVFTMATLALLPVLFLVLHVVRSYTYSKTVEKELVNVTRQITSLNKEITQLRKGVTQIDTEAKDHIKDYEENRKTTNNTVNVLTKRIETQGEDVAEIKIRFQENAELFKTIPSVQEKLSALENRMNGLQTDIDTLKSAKMSQPFRAGKALIYFVHCERLQEPKYHPCWSELADRLGHSKFRYTFVCLAQEEDSITTIYDPSRQENSPINSVATHATMRINWPRLRERLENDRDVRFLCIVSPDAQILDNAITGANFPIHFIVVGGNSVIDASQITNRVVVHFIPDSPEALTQALYDIIRQDAAAQFAFAFTRTN